MMKVQARMLVPGLEALARRPRLEQRFLDEIVGEVAAARQRAAEGAQMRDDRRQLILEFVIGQRDRLGESPLRRSSFVGFVGH